MTWLFLSQDHKWHEKIRINKKVYLCILFENKYSDVSMEEKKAESTQHGFSD